MKPTQGDGLDFQQRVAPFMLACFGAEVSADRQERAHRFLEEALELAQALGCTVGEAEQLTRYVFARPKGEVASEVGGVMVTLAALALAAGVDMHSAGDHELERVSGMIDRIQAKWASRPKSSPLPGAYPDEPAGERVTAPPATAPVAGHAPLHGEPDDCPTYYDGCHCVEAAEAFMNGPDLAARIRELEAVQELGNDLADAVWKMLENQRPYFQGIGDESDIVAARKIREVDHHALRAALIAYNKARAGATL